MAGKGLGGFGSSKVMKLPTGLPVESYTWINLNKVITDSLADSWFEDIGTVPISSFLTPNELGDKSTLQESLPFFFGEDEIRVLPNNLREFSDLGEPVILEESPLGKKLLKVLEQESITWDYTPERLEITEFEGVLGLSLRQEGRGQWGTYFGMPYDQFFKIYKNRSSGQEVLLWGADILAATRPFEHLKVYYGYDEQTNARYMIQNDENELAAGGLTYGQQSTRIFIPVLLKKLFYLGETPFPTLNLNFPRSMAYGEDFPQALFPKPYFLNKKRSRVSGAYDQNSQGFLASAAKLPSVIEAGWIIHDMSEEQLSKCVSVASNALTIILTILEDGYLNHNKNGSQSNIWDQALGSGVTLDEDCEYGVNAMGLSTWIPIPRIGIALNDTYQRAPRALQEDIFAELEDISFNGVGPLVANCINSFVFSHLMDTQHHYMTDRLLEAAYLMDVQGESTNALSNWGISYFKRGELENAKDKFFQALEREDNYSEAEASWWLAKIFDLEGNSKRADEFRSRCQEAGGYDYETELLPPAIVDPNQVAESETERPRHLGGSPDEPFWDQFKPLNISRSMIEGQSPGKFCSNCGERFQDLGNFCGNCGKKRNSNQIAED